MDSQTAEPDEEIDASAFGIYWAVLTDKGYQGALEFTRVVHPPKIYVVRGTYSFRLQISLEEEFVRCSFPYLHGFDEHACNMVLFASD